MPSILTPTTAFVSAGYMQALLDHLQTRGMAPAFLAQLQLPENRQQRIRETLAANCFNLAAAQIGDDALGLHAGEGIRPEHYGALGHVAMSCQTLGQALVYQQRYQSLVLSIAAPTVHLAGQEMIYAWQPNTGDDHRQLAEFHFAGLLTFARWLTGLALRPIRIDLTYPPPQSLHEHHRVLCSALRFDQPAYRLVLPLAWLSLPLRYADPSLQQLLDQLLAERLAGLQGDDFRHRLEALIGQHLAHGPPTLAELAEQLGLSARRLQRQLAERRLRYIDLLDQIRRSRAEHYLRTTGLDLHEVAFLLGYSEPSAFTRAFRRWFGQAPTVWRAQLAPGPTAIRPANSRPPL